MIVICRTLLLPKADIKQSNQRFWEIYCWLYIDGPAKIIVRNVQKPSKSHRFYTKKHRHRTAFKIDHRRGQIRDFREFFSQLIQVRKDCNLSFLPILQLFPKQPKRQIDVHEGESKSESQVSAKFRHQVERGVSENFPRNGDGFSKHEHQPGFRAL